MFGLVVVALLVLAALFAPFLAPYNPNEFHTPQRFSGPSMRFLLGSDQFGRDTLSRLLFGARVSIVATIQATIAISITGVTLGVLAGYFGGIIDTIIVGIVDILLALPDLILVFVVIGFLGPGIRNIIIGLSMVFWVGSARIARGAVLSLREQLYVEAARSAGATRRRLIFRHLLPNILGRVIVYTSLEIGSILLSISALSFLGLGISPPTAEWGSMLSEAKAFIGVEPQLMLWPGATIFLFVIGFNLLGDGLRDILDPKTRRTEA